MHKLLCLMLTLYSALAYAQQPRIPVVAGFLPIDDGSFHVVILLNDPANLPFRGAHWNVGLIQTESKGANAGAVTNPTGCWTSTGVTQGTDTIQFRYMSPTDGAVREFGIEPIQLHRMIYEWHTERLYPTEK